MKNKLFMALQLFAEDPAVGQDQSRRIQNPPQNTRMRILTGCSTRSLQK